ncbi:GAF domain-containing sensor histidine kinase [Sulfobacillus harzensis]|uniref:GAF domain-containing protein n=1 Tax=Sulfobacillus harzensis TaxID=2729629 RepID=A0A7Y0Q4Z4_9FIRM|nr:GAF domain-containing protein [Sulfobacillus harzensis]NMP24541.1 GAF domain-containing protein [Sulfobacillus harzensis]
MTRGDQHFYQQIVDNAKHAVGVPWVQLTAFDAKSGTIKQLAVSRFSVPRIRRAAGTFRRLANGRRILDVVATIDANATLRALYSDGQTIDMPLSMVAQGTVPRAASRLAEVVGLRQTLGIPLRVNGEIVGALNFHSPRPYSAQQRTIAEAFCRQVELTIENRELTRRLDENVRLLTAVQRRLISAEDSVKRELAEELHGRVQTRLLLAWRRLQRLADTMAEGTLQHQLRAILDELDSIREEDVRGLSHRLMPPILSTGVYSALSFLAALYAPEMAVSVSLEPDVVERPDIHEPILPEDLRLTLYRVAEEALANAYHHGEARNAAVRLVVRPDKVGVCVVDDGLGFHPGEVQDNLGLTLMRARVEQFSGTLTIHSQVGTGTIVRATIVPQGALREYLHRAFQERGATSRG